MRGCGIVFIPLFTPQNQEIQEMGQSEPLCLGTKVMHASRRLLEVVEETQFINYSKDKVLATVVLERRGRFTVAGLGTGEMSSWNLSDSSSSSFSSSSSSSA